MNVQTNVNTIEQQGPADQGHSARQGHQRGWLLIAPLLMVAMLLVLHSSQPALALGTPVVSGLSPSTGPAAGGTTVTITGTGFTGATSVKFGANNAAGLSVVDDSHIIALSAAGALGTVTVTVTTPSGTSVASAGSSFTYAAPVATVSSVSPGFGPVTGGTTVVISGANLTGASSVSFGGTPATTFVVDNSTQITATSPAHTLGAVSVVVTTPSGVASGSFSYQSVTLPSITSLSPNSGPTTGNTPVTITGSGFIGATGVQFVVGIPYTVVNDTTITVNSPPAVAGAVGVSVTTPAGSSPITGASTYTFINPAAPPVVSGLSPATGPTAGNTSVIITGAGFSGVTQVMFGLTAAASYVYNGPTQITAVSPAGSGTVNVAVTTGTGTSSSSVNSLYTYGTVGVPSISSLSPASGLTSGGTTVIITGTNFTSASAVTFGLTPATAFTLNSAVQITATSPAGAAGATSVTVTTPGGTSAGAVYTYLASIPPPVLTGISPTSGPTAGGTPVIITGTGLTGATLVMFGLTAAPSITVNSDTQVTATSPAAAAAGPIYITVTTSAGTSALTQSGYFTYGATSGTPVIYSLNPTTGPTSGGTSVSITGSGFTGATTVMFGAVSASFTPINDGSLTAISPPGAAGSVNVTVNNVSGTGTAALFTYGGTAGGPNITGISPSTGPTSGGTSVTIYGSGFTGTYSVTFGASSATFSVVSDTQITTTSPAGALGTVSVTVTGSGGTSPASSFTYTTAAGTAVISGLSPTSGPTVGGTSVLVYGSGFTGATSVLFGTLSATYTVNSDTQITATSPAASAGTVNVTVTTASGTSAISAGSSFTYTGTSSLPVITFVSPGTGPTTGGTSVVISGTGFTGATSVRFGGNGATYTVNGDTQITATSPAGNAGSTTVVVTTAAGTSSATSASSFTYTARSNLCPLIPLWVDDLAYGSPGGGFYWDGGVSGEVWTAQRGWHYFSPQPVRPAPRPLWVDALTYGSAGGGFWWDPISDQVWTGERNWHQYAPTGCTPR